MANIVLLEALMPFILYVPILSICMYERCAQRHCIEATAQLFTQESLDEYNDFIQRHVGECCRRNSRLSIPDTPLTLCR